MALLLQGVLMGAVLKKVEVNGVEIPVIFEQEKELPIVSMQVVFQKSGSIEDGNLSGLAKMSAKLLNQGTKSLGNVGFATKLEERAIRFGVHSGVETMAMEISSLKDQFEKGVEIVKGVFEEPNLTPQTLQKIKVTTLGYLSRKENDYDYIASINLKKLLFKDTPLENPSDGTVDSIQKITLEDIEKFLKKHLVLKRVIAVIGGDIEWEEAKKLLKNFLSPLPTGELEPLPFYNAKDYEKEKVIPKEEIEQAYIYFGSPYYLKLSSEELYLSRLAMFILGAGGFGSRLMEEIRVKRGLAYSAYGFARVNKSHSYFSGYLQTKLSSANEAKEIVKEVIKEFVENGATPKELEQAKKFILGSEPLRNETLSQRLSRAFREFYADKPLGWSKKELEKIEKVDLKTLNDFIKNHSEIIKLSFSIVKK